MDVAVIAALHHVAVGDEKLISESRRALKYHSYSGLLFQVRYITTMDLTYVFHENFLQSYMYIVVGKNKSSH